MRVPFVLAGMLLLVPAICCAQQLTIPPSQLVREVVYNELHDHDAHGFWRFSIERHAQHGTRIEEQIETADGPVTRLVQNNGRPLSAAGQQLEQTRLEHLLASPSEQARLRKEHADDEKRISRILALLPYAFLFENAGDENGCHHLRFHPNPDYPAHSIEARVFHAMSGELWIDARMKHLARLDGQLQTNVDFGFGILGRLYKGGWFHLQRTQVSPTEWKTARLEVHMNARAMLFKTIAHETSEIRSGFAPVPANITLAQAMDLLRPSQTAASESSAAEPGSFVSRR